MRAAGGFIRKFVAAALLIICLTQSAFAAQELVPVGRVAGISVETDGVLVLDVSTITSESGSECTPAKDAGILPGDIITRIGSSEIETSEELKTAVGGCSGKTVSVTVLRDGKDRQMAVTPVLTEEGTYEIGVWLRDAMAGLGTITFYDPQSGKYGALGHGISDIDTGVLFPLRSGVLMNACITDVVRGEPGAPGQLHGTFSFDEPIGNAVTNTENGLFGTITSEGYVDSTECYPVASEDEIVLGKAHILSNVEGESVQEFEIEIVRLYTGLDGIGRDMMICVKDEALLEKTGGIVQGMSGSPIIQNGKLVGAVTHVLVNDPTRGYGIFIENMLEAAENSEN